MRIMVMLCAGAAWILLGWTPAAAQRDIDPTTRMEIDAVKEYMRAHPQPSAAAATGSAVKDAGVSDAPLKPAAQADRKLYFMNGNKVSTNVYNYGGIGPGYDALRGVNNLVWRGLDYGFQFCPFVAASVSDATNPARRFHIVSDGLWDYPAYREVSPDGTTLWAWQPLPGYADPDQQFMASNPAPDANKDGKPDSWPRSWYNPTLGRYVWPGYLSQDVLAADQEVYWAMDDRENREFDQLSSAGQYFPFISDSSRSGLGVQVDGRAFQWSNALAENTIFFVYTITNVSDKDLDSVVFGIYGDADLGGGSPENTDDNGYFIPPYDSTGAIDKVPVYSRSMVYFWDPDMKGARGLPLGYIGCKFLESPGNPNDTLDNDGDGLINERQDDGLDNDGDWNPINDDTGIDGIPNTNDPGEGDGVPTAGLKRPDGSLDPLFPGELNFELTDLDESDQIGLSSFNSWSWSTDAIKNDESMWFRSVPRNFGQIQQDADIVFIFGSGYISLKRGETKRISMALLFGQTLDDLLVSAKSVQTIYNNNYRFFKPPITPHMTVVPGDRKVELYWDDRAEQSVDPIAGKDFEGYVIYRSVDPSFNDIQTVTDGKGAQFLTTPLKDITGKEAKWDVAIRDDPFTDVNQNGVYDSGEPYVDLNKDGRWTAGWEDYWKGYHPVPYQDRGVQYYLGNNSGLVHSYVDSNNVINGQTYYYAVVAYDHGDSIGVPPTESPKKITVDPITSVITFDVNTAQVLAGPRVSGYIPPPQPDENAAHASGLGTGSVVFQIKNDLAIKDGHEYQLTFADSSDYGTGKILAKNYSVLDVSPYSETAVLYDTNFASLGRINLVDDGYFSVTNAAGAPYARDADYVVNFDRGSLRRTGNSSIPNQAEVRVTYRYTPVYQSRRLAGEDGNAVFDGVNVLVTDAPPLDYDPGRSRWLPGSASNLGYTMGQPGVGSRKKSTPFDYEIQFSASNIDTALTISGGIIRIPVRYTVHEVSTGVPRKILTLLREPSVKNLQWDPGDEIIMFQPGSTGVGTDTVNWGVTVTLPADTSVAPVLPTDGDVLFMGTSRPFNTQDVYTLRTVGGRVENAVAAGRLDNIYVVPNPYVGYNIIEPTNRLPGEARGERRLYFENLPAQCTIRIFTVNGDLVQTLERNSGVDNGREFWNLLNRDGFSVAYGVYVAHIDAPGIGEKIVKFAIIK